MREKVLSELKGKLLQDGGSKFSFEGIHDLEYFMMVFNETLRLEPPVIFSSLMTVNDPTDINGIKINTKDNMIVNLHQLHHDPDQW